MREGRPVRACPLDFLLNQEEKDAMDWLCDTFELMEKKGSVNATKAAICKDVIEQMLEALDEKHKALHHYEPLLVMAGLPIPDYDCAEKVPVQVIDCPCPGCSGRRAEDAPADAMKN